MNKIFKIKKTIIFIMFFLSIVLINHYSLGAIGFNSFDNSPRMSITCSNEGYDDVIIKFRDFSSLDESKIVFYTAKNGQIGSKITDSNFIKKIDKNYGTNDTSILVDCIFTISNEYLAQKTNEFYVVASDKYGSACKLEAFFRIKSTNGKYTVDTSPRVITWKANQDECSFIVQDWVGVNYVKLYDMNGKDPSKVVYEKNNLPRGNSKIVFSANNFTQKNGKYQIKIVTQDSNNTNKQTATRVVRFSLLPKTENENNNNNNNNNNTSNEKISLNKTSISLKVGETCTLNASVTSNNKTVTWKSANTSIAKVDSNGKVSAIAKGKTSITAKLESGKSTSCSVTVEEKDNSSSNSSTNTKGKQKLIESLKYAYKFSTQAGGHITYINSSNGDHRNAGKLEQGYSDCSHFVHRVFEHTGMMKKFVKSEMWGYHGCPNTKDVAVFQKGQKWNYSDASPGDVIWEHYGSGRNNHVYIYLGNGLKIGCSSGHPKGKAVNVGSVRRADSSTKKYLRKIVHFIDFPYAPNSYFDTKTQTIKYK